MNNYVADPLSRRRPHCKYLLPALGVLPCLLSPAAHAAQLLSGSTDNKTVCHLAQTERAAEETPHESGAAKTVATSAEIETPAVKVEVEKARVLLAQTDVAPPSVGSGGIGGGPGAAVGPAPPKGTAETVPPAGVTPDGAPIEGAPAGTPGAPPAGAPAMPSFPMLLGYAGFMITIDRPFEAEKIYNNILAMTPDPDGPAGAQMPPAMKEQITQARTAAKAGLKDAKFAERPTYTALGHGYSDDRDVNLYAYGAGPTFRTPYGRITLTAGTGHYRNNNDPNNANNPQSKSPDIPTAADNDTLKKNTINLLLEPYYKKWEGSVFLSNVTYDAAPNRFLYDFKLSYVPDPARKRFYVSTGRHDSYFQNVNNQFYAPESYFQLVKKTLYDDYSFGAEYPVAKKIDATYAYRYFKYSDGNRRANYRTQLLYRILPKKGQQMPVWRVGFDFIFDDSKFFTLDYTASNNFNAYSIATDYLWVARKLKYGAYASYAVASQNFNAPNGVFGFASYQVTRNAELYAKVAQLSGRGNSLTFGDYVIGVNTRF